MAACVKSDLKQGHKIYPCLLGMAERKIKALDMSYNWDKLEETQ